MFTPTCRLGYPSSASLFANLQAASKKKYPKGTIKSWRSAMGMNSTGETRPLEGEFIRAKASKPTMR